jgi:hypothetical protein
MLLIVLFLLNFSWLRSQCSPIEIDCYARCNLRF